MSGENRKEREPWYPKSRKAVMRRWLRQNRLPMLTDTMTLVRLVRRHPVLLQETQNEKAERALADLRATSTTAKATTLVEKLRRDLTEPRATSLGDLKDT